MNAKEQYIFYGKQMNAIAAECREKEIALTTSGNGWDIAKKILSDLKLSFEAYGDKAYPLTEKQEALIKRVIADYREGLDRELALLERVAPIIEQMQAKHARAISPLYDGETEWNPERDADFEITTEGASDESLKANDWDTADYE